jgi:hypothetical protein
MSCNTGQTYAPGLKMKEEQNVIRDQTSPREHLNREEIDSGQDRHMRSDELLPVCVLATLRRRRDAMTAKDVAHCLIRDNVAEVRQSSDNPIVTPARVLSRHLDHQFHDLALNWRPARIRALAGTIELLGDESAVPGKYRVRFGHTGDLFQSFAAQSLANFGECRSLRI